MSDDLLDEATRLVLGDMLYTEENIDRVLRALVERVQQTEAERDMLEAQRNESNNRADAARAKLDKVRDWAHHIRTTRERGDIEYNAACDVLAILDEKDPT
jgi:hypothetical protein